MKLWLHQATLFCTPVGDDIEFLHIFNYHFHFEVIWGATSITFADFWKIIIMGLNTFSEWTYKIGH